MRPRFTDGERVKAEARRNALRGISQIKRWWSQKYNLPPNHPLCEGRSMADLTREMYEDLFVRRQELPDQIIGVGIAHQGAGRHLDQAGLAVGAVLLLGGSDAAGGGSEMTSGEKILQGRELDVRADEDVSSPAPISPVRDGVTGPKISVKRAASVTAPARLDPDLGLVDESGQLARTATTPGFGKTTIPSRRAKRVSSPPRPTLRPGLTRVPRWRIRMEPAVTICPPYALTPRRLELESRPFREDPCALVCAIF